MAKAPLIPLNDRGPFDPAGADEVHLPPSPGKSDHSEDAYIPSSPGGTGDVQTSLDDIEVLNPDDGDPMDSDFDWKESDIEQQTDRLRKSTAGSPFAFPVLEFVNHKPTL
jgi:hypothetical protein